MEKLKKLEERDYSNLIKVLFGIDSPTPVPSKLEQSENCSGPILFLDQTLNDSQKEAIRFALASREVALIHGPPGVSASVLCILNYLIHLRRAKHTL